MSVRPNVHRDAMLLIGFVTGAAIAAGKFATPVDAVAYWHAGSSGHLYPDTWSSVGAGYLFYPPPVAQLSTLLQPVGWSAFIVALMTATFGAFWYCAREWSLPLVVLGIPYYVGIGPAAPATFLGYALLGNLQWILAALAVVAVRRPALWSILLITKVSTGIGWWWHVLRGDWRLAAVGGLASAVVIAVSVAGAPNLWIDFVGFAVRNRAMSDPPLPTFPVPFAIRLATATPVLLWAARTDRSWVVPGVVGWSLPALYGLGFLPFWVAALRLRSYGPVIDESGRGGRI